MSNKEKRAGHITNKVVVVITSLIYILMFSIIAHNITLSESETLWYDEAGQFFISKGLNHFSIPFSEEGGLKEVLYNNARYNMDPGGFSVILHFWSMIANNVVWLRMLPYIFYVGTCVFTCLIAFEITKNKVFSFICGLIMFTLWKGTTAYELRAYSMELCGLAFGLWSVFRLRHNPSTRNYFIFSMILSILITSRYTAIVFGGIFTVFILLDIVFAKADFREKIYWATTYSLPLIITVTWVYFNMTRIQNSSLSPLYYIIYLPGIDKFMLCFFACAAIPILTYPKQSSYIKELINIFIVINVVFFVLGFLDMLPFKFFGNKGAPFVWIWMLTIMISAYGFIADRWTTKQWTNLAAFLCIVSTIFYVNDRININSIPPHRFDMASETLRKIDFSKVDKLYVSEGSTCVVRYLYEYGVLKTDAKDIYPSKFILLDGYVHCKGNDSFIKNKKEHNYQILLNLPEGSHIMSCMHKNDLLNNNEAFSNVYGLYYIKIR